MSSSEPVLSCRDLSKTYGNRFTKGNIVALNQASFSILEGEICGLVGPNGAGKSTLIKLVMGIEPRDSGAVMMNELDPRVALGYVPERPTFFEDLSAYYNILYFARLTGAERPEETSLHLIDEFGLKGRGDDRVSSFSKGMKQRLAIARAVVHGPRVLIMDEPFSGLDPGMMLELRGLLKDLKRKGMAMLLSSHELNEIDQLCDTILFIKSGSIIRREDLDSPKLRTVVQLTLEKASDAVAEALTRWSKISFSDDRTVITVEASREELPEIVAAAVKAGGRVMEFRPAQVKAEDLYAEVFRAEVTT